MGKAVERGRWGRACRGLGIGKGRFGGAASSFRLGRVMFPEAPLLFFRAQTRHGFAPRRFGVLRRQARLRLGIGAGRGGRL